MLVEAVVVAGCAIVSDQPDSPDSEPPPTEPSRSAADRSRGRRHREERKWWGFAFAVLGWTALVAAVGALIAGQFVRVDYYTEAPGDAVAVQPLVEIEGAPVYDDTEGQVYLLFVRRRDHITLFRWLQAALDPDIDAKSTDYDEPGSSPADLDGASTSAMSVAQLAAKKLALEKIGLEIELLDGLEVASTIAGRPAATFLRAGDVILEVDGVVLDSERATDQFAATIREHDPGETVSITYERDGERETVDIETVDNGEGIAIIGVFPQPHLGFPIDIRFGGQIESIGGPSAGLAMTLALIDDLTPGDLSGGLQVAVTGTIDINGEVGEVGRVDLKAKAADRRGATLMLVPKCTEPSEPDAYANRDGYAAAVDFFESCESEVAAAKRAVDRVVEVDTLDEALAALEAAGGDPLPPVAAPATAP